MTPLVKQIILLVMGIISPNVSFFFLKSHFHISAFLQRELYLSKYSCICILILTATLSRDINPEVPVSALLRC